MKKIIKDYLYMILGCIIAAIGTGCFLLPNQLSSGGFSGIATIMYYFWEVPMGTAIIVMNIPLFVFAYFRLGKSFLLKAVLATFMYSKAIDFFENFDAMTDDRFLSSIYGGIFIGVGLALVFKAQSSTGGTDLIVSIIKSYSSKIKTSNLLTIMDVIVVGLNLIFFKKIEIGLYSAIAILIIGKMIDIVFEGINFSKMLYIISEKNELISEKIEVDLERGVTGLYGKGMYKDNNKMILLCVVNRRDVPMVKELALSIDKNAFIIISDAREVYGLGFK